MKNILVTGASGFLGSYVIEELLKKEFNVTALVREETPKLEYLTKKISFLKKNISNINDFDLKGIDAIIHLASAGVSPKIVSIQELFRINVEATANIYSIADSSKLGGKLGWIDSDQVSKNIIDNLKILNPGDLTKPISVPGGFLILKLNDKKITQVEKDFDIKKETEKAIQYQKNKQLAKFSKVYFSRIKKNSFISE